MGGMTVGGIASGLFIGSGEAVHVVCITDADVNMFMGWDMSAPAESDGVVYVEA